MKKIDRTKVILSEANIDVVSMGTGCCGDKASTDLSKFDAVVNKLNKAGVKVNIVPTHLELDTELRKFPPMGEDGKYISKGCAACEIPFDIFNPFVRKAYLRVLENVTKRYSSDERIFGFTLFGPGLMIEWEYYIETWKKPKFPAYSPPAQESFRKYIKKRYATLGTLNARWSTSFSDWNDVQVPKPATAFREGAFDLRADWLDFTEWYQSELISFLRETLQATRKHTKKPIVVLFASSYGSRQGRTGVFWGKAVKMMTNYKPIYIKSNGTEKMVASYAEEISSFYDIGLWFESPQIKDEEMIKFLVDNAYTFKADFIHLNSLTTLLHLFEGNAKRTRQIVSSNENRGIRNKDIAFLHNASASFLGFQTAKDVLDYQNVDLISIYSSGPLWQNVFNIGEYMNLPPIIDEELIRDGALERFKTLIIPNRYEFLLPLDVAEKVIAWMAKGGILIYIKKGYVINISDNKLIDFEELILKNNIDSGNVKRLEKLNDLKILFNREAVRGE